MTLLRKREIDRPAAIKSTPDGRKMYLALTAPLAETLGATVDCDVFGGSLIVCLLDRCCPSAILGRVIAIVVNAINRVLGRRFPAHISEEVLEDQPPFAHADTATSVSMECAVTWVCATLRDMSPCIKFRGVALSVCGEGGFYSLYLKAAAGLRMSVSQVAACCNNLASASTKFWVTETPPFGLPAFGAPVVFHDTKESPACAGHVFDVSVPLGRLLCSHDVNLQLGLRMVRAGAGCILRSARFIVPERLCLS